MTSPSRPPSPPVGEDRSSSILVRPSTPGDIERIHSLYELEVLTGTATFEEIPPTVSEIAARRESVLALGCPYLVAEGSVGVVGFAYAGSFRRQSACRLTVENSVYVAPDALRAGIARALMERLVADCRDAGFQQMIAMIGSENEGSIAFHSKLGFRQVGRLAQVGLKFGRLMDVVIMQRSLDAGAPDQK